MPPMCGARFDDSHYKWDDDLIAGSVIIWQNSKFLCSVMQVVHGGYISLDMYPDREEGIPVASMSIGGINWLVGMLKRLDRAELTATQKTTHGHRTSEVARLAVYWGNEREFCV